MAFINMKKKPVKIRTIKPSFESKREQYPYELRITFNNESLNKLGLKLKDYNVKDKLEAKIKCEVIGLRSNEDAFGSGSESMELQIIGIDLG